MSREGDLQLVNGLCFYCLFNPHSEIRNPKWKDPQPKILNVTIMHHEEKVKLGNNVP